MNRKKKNGNSGVTVRIGGEAGQGMNTISELLGKTFVRRGLRVFTNHNVMSRIRGGHNFSQIRLSSSPVGCPSSHVDILVCLDRNTLDLYRDSVEAVFIYDLDEAPEDAPEGENFLAVPLEKIAKEAGGDARMVNSVASGAVLALLNVELDELLNLLKETFSSKGKEIVEANRRCAREGFRYARENYGGRALWEVPEKRGAGEMLVTGSEAMALGALASGLRFYSAYPMSPATAIMVYLASRQDDFDIVVEQAEDEISAVNMVIGASFAGARSMVATSGGGMALMAEGISLAAMTETPLVIIDCQRPAPATGLPTRTEQGDLLFAAHTSHGEFPRVILAPSTAEEAFYSINKAFYLAEKYHIPVFVLGDQFLNDSAWTVEPFDLNRLRLERDGMMPEGELSQMEPYSYLRYRITESGVSPRIVPGTPGQIIYADSDEHDETGHITESGEVRNSMVRKRLGKFQGLTEEMDEPVVFPDKKRRTYAVSWGSTLKCVDEAVRILRDEGADLGYIHFRDIYPIKSPSVFSSISQGSRFIGVENNATGQLARLLRMEGIIDMDDKILKFDGRPFTYQELTEEIRKRAGE